MMTIQGQLLWIPLGVGCCFDSGTIVTGTVSSTGMTLGSKKNTVKIKWRNAFADSQNCIIDNDKLW